MLKSGKRECLTRTVGDGTYTYFKRGTNIECFPIYFQGDVGGSRGQVSFRDGGLTNAPHPFRGVVGSDSAWHEGDAPTLGVDVVFDFKRPCRLSDVSVQTPSERLLDRIDVAVKSREDEPYRLVRSLGARDVGRELGGSDPFRIEALNCEARFLKLFVLPQGPELCLRYVEVWGHRQEPMTPEETSVLMPSPSKIVPGRGKFRPPAAGVLAVCGASRNARFNARYLGKRLDAVVETRRASVPGRECMLVWCDKGDVDGVLKRLQAAPPAEEIGAEGYVLTVTRRAVVIEAASDQGVFYGTQSLLQLAEGADEIGCIAVIDKPHKPLRAVHLFVPSREQIPFFKRFVSEYLCRLKYNTIFIQVSGGMEYKKRPEINREWVKFSKTIKESREDSGERPATESVRLARAQNCTHWDLADGGFISQDEMRDLVQFCKAHYFDVVPEVQSLSHCYYLMIPHKEFAEDRCAAFPDTYCPSNPKVYEYVFDVLDEIVEVFQPSMLHIGHDEWYTMCVCPRCKGKSAADLFARDIKRLHKHLKAKGVKTAMWCDRLLPMHGGLGAKFAVITQDYFCDGREIMGAADKLPKDILMLNWTNFLPGAEDRLKDKGFEQIFGNFNPAFPDWEERSACSAIPGGETSSWIAVGEYNYAQGVLRNMLLCSHALWSGTFLDPRIDAGSKLLLNLIRTRKTLGRGQSTWLDPEARTTCLDITRRANSAWPVQGAPSRVTVHGVPFLVTGKDDALRAVSVQDAAARSPAYPPGSAPIPVGRRARSLFFLHACSDFGIHHVPSKAFGGPCGAPVGEYVVTYGDGKKSRIPVRYGEQVASVRFGGTLADSPVSYYALPVWRGMDATGEPVTLYVFEWVNPRPDARIRHFALKAASGGTDLVWSLFGVTVAR